MTLWKSCNKRLWVLIGSSFWYTVLEVRDATSHDGSWVPGLFIFSDRDSTPVSSLAVHSINVFQITSNLVFTLCHHERRQHQLWQSRSTSYQLWKCFDRPIFSWVQIINHIYDILYITFYLFPQSLFLPPLLPHILQKVDLLCDKK